MTSVRILESKKILLVSKTFAKAASRFDSEEYRELRAARNDFPGFKVVIKQTAAKKNDHFKGLTYEYMERYIAAHDDDAKSTMKKFLDLRGVSDEAREALAESCSYTEIKNWFLSQYGEISKFHSDRATLLDGTVA